MFDLISNDQFLKRKLNTIFSNISQNKNKLNEEYNINLLYLLFIKEIKIKLEKWIKEKQITSISYNMIKYEIKYSFIQYIYNLSIKYAKTFESTQISENNFKYNHFALNQNIIKGIILDYCSLLNNFVITLFPKDSNYLDNAYIDFIEEQIIKSRTKNKMTQNIKLILIFDENNYYRQVIKEIKYSNIKEIAIIFDDEKMIKNSLLKDFDKYLSNIKHLESINKIIFFNKAYNNYLSNNIDSKINVEKYQSLLNDFFDYLYIEKENNIKNITKLIQNINDIYIENIGTIYIYEKLKLYYFINVIFHSLKLKVSTKDNTNFQYYINNKVLIIKNKDKPLKVYELLILISDCLNKHKLKYLCIFNNNSIIFDEQQNYNNIKFKNSNLDEFIYISEDSENNNKLIEYLFLLIMKTMIIIIYMKDMTKKIIVFF